MSDAEAQRKARIEARRRRLAAQEANEDRGGGNDDSGMGGRVWLHGQTHPLSSTDVTGMAKAGRSLSPVREDDDASTAEVIAVSKKSVSRPMQRTDHQDIFGTRSSAAEGLVDPATRPAKARGGANLVGATASKLDLDFASVERASVRAQRSAQESVEVSSEHAHAAAMRAAQAHKAAVMSAEQANRPQKAAATAAAAAGAYATSKSSIDSEEERALQRLMVGPREEADGLGTALARKDVAGKSADAKKII